MPLPDATCAASSWKPGLHKQLLKEKLKGRSYGGYHRSAQCASQLPESSA
ncbi:hypothetical protein CSB93_7065 (plasmid) [Pseudomonas paraeruginosa]|uniref:Uncharacterized protein n=1 Tax=Pseudomonas paraeruginosa TaxID=2994495 RepID=A0A2R3IKX7_9PSED|nr:hypothetical protein CSB93_7065 [Pseudomonas paraeruginosa]AWE88985.1 hypothetical protein CSC28_7010 [Pseudomonas paraeruginosa]